jgi:hypothetical protein
MVVDQNGDLLFEWQHSQARIRLAPTKQKPW